MAKQISDRYIPALIDAHNAWTRLADVATDEAAAVAAWYELAAALDVLTDAWTTYRDDGIRRHRAGRN